jgi:hypothetical protein
MSGSSTSLLLIAGALAALAGAARAQLGLPSVRLPALPATPLIQEVQNGPANLSQEADVHALERARALHVRELLHRYPRLIERDPRGAPAVRGEVLALALSDAAREQALAAGFTVLREGEIEELDLRLAVLGAPPGMSTELALQRLRSLDPAGQYDYDHLFSTSADAVAPAAPGTADGSAPPLALRADAGRTRIGLIDDGVDADHPVFRDAVIRAHGCAGKSNPAAHGTAVASLMVGRAERFNGAAPGAELYAADVYCGQPTGGSVDAIVEAMGWLARERVAVINVSLVGPANVLLEAAVRALIARGHLIVAAVGNDGPAAPPLYPAAYPGVIGVTGVDARRHVLLEAERGAQVKFAAYGADMAAARPPGGYALVRGTSFAAPIVAGLLALQLAAPGSAAAEQAVAALARQAIDLGAPGPDPVYGLGLVGAAVRPDPALASTRNSTR